MKKTLHILISILIAQAAGILGSIFTMPSLETWYLALEKPVWNPPSWIFAPVWITLYTLMGIAAYLVWQKRKEKNARFALIIYVLHLALNALWSILFFGLQDPAAGFAGIVILLTFIIWTAALFWRINKWAGWLFVPYIAWGTFATILNFTIWQLN